MGETLQARLRRRLDRDIRQGLKRLEREQGGLEQGDISDLVRDGVRKVLVEKGMLPNDDQNSKRAQTEHQSISSDIRTRE